MSAHAQKRYRHNWASGSEPTLGPSLTTGAPERAVYIYTRNTHAHHASRQMYTIYM